MMLLRQSRRAFSTIPETFKACLVRKPEKKGPTSVEIADVREQDLPEGEVTVAVAHSSFNYKDGLAVLGKPGVVRTYPETGFVPGIDFAGTVVKSESESYSEGDKVVLTGWGVGETRWGGFAQFARTPAKMLLPLPDGLSTEDAMSVGTAGLTSMLCVLALEHGGVKPGGDLPVLVTGAAGGVGSVAVSILANLGYNVTASTGREALHPFLKSLGATNVVGREEIEAAAARPLGKETWAGVVDCVGSTTLAGALASTAYGGTVASCGLAGGHDLPTTVMPFILRGVTLSGVDSVYASPEKRREAWSRIVTDLPLDTVRAGAGTSTVPLSDIPQLADQILGGKVKGRVVVDVNA